MQLILAELWEDAVFNEHSMAALQRFSELTEERHLKPEDAFEQCREDMYYSLSTSRNRNLISTFQQDRLRNTVVGFFGLSVGSNAAITWMLESRAKDVKIADPDYVSPTNLNRLQFGWDSVGQLKVDVVAEFLLSINPFTRVVKVSEKSFESTKELFLGENNLDIVVDAIDDVQGKILLRRLCKEYKIPLVSAADVGDNVTLDIERYDLSPQPDFFLGRVPEIEKLDLSKLSENARRRTIVQLVGYEEHSEEMLSSLLGLGETLGTWPQLGATATIGGGVVTTVIKKIVLGEKVKSGRYYISFDGLLASDYNSRERKEKRRELIEKVEKKLNKI